MHQPDACRDMTEGDCPVEEGELIEYSVEMPILDSYPAVKNITYIICLCHSKGSHPLRTQQINIIIKLSQSTVKTFLDQAVVNIKRNPIKTQIIFQVTLVGIWTLVDDSNADLLCFEIDITISE